MALMMDVERARGFGIGSPYKSVAELLMPDPKNASQLVVNSSRTTVSLAELPTALVGMVAYQNKIGVGCSGSGVDPELLSSLLGPCLLWFLAFLLMRYWCHEYFARFGIYMGVVTENAQRHRKRLAEGKRGVAALSAKNQKKIFKFQNQLWLTFFYIISSTFGYAVQRGQPWFTIPLTEESCVHLLVPHPYNPGREMVFYYQYGLAFYLAESVSLIFLEKDLKRSDFVEYIFHHIVTVALMVLSHIGWEHRFGAYVLFIHDVSDIMLSLAKVFHYIVNEDSVRATIAKERGRRYRSPWLFRYVLTENFVNLCFVAFIALFFYFRLYCLPMVAHATFGMAPRLRHGNVNMWVLVVLLNVALQSLHIYWGMLIIIMVVSLVKGGERKDLRSESEDKDELPDLPVWAEVTSHEGEIPLKKD